MDNRNNTFNNHINDLEYALVSVIIPCFNGAEVIDDSIGSVYEQDYPNIELIVVNDGSTDNSGELILAWKDKFEQKGFRFQYVYQPNRGLAGAIDTGLKSVTGDYLTLLDADDFFLPGSVRKRAAFLDDHKDYAGVRTNGWIQKGSEKTLFITSEKEKTTTDYFNALIYDAAANWAGSYMVRTELLFAFYPDRNIYPSRFGQNMQIILPVAYKRKFGLIDEPLMVYVVHDNSLSQAASIDDKREKNDQNFYGYHDIYRHMIEIIIQDEKEKAKYLNVLNSWVFRHECEKAIDDNNKRELKSNYRQLELTGQAKIDDKVKYYSFIHSPKALFYRVKRKIINDKHK